jgi:predicted deacetylase
MEVIHTAALTEARTPPALLVSLHDVSPLTLEACQEALGLLTEAGLNRAALTVLVIPHHEGRVTIGQHAPTIRFLRDLTEDGATLVMHGLTHRMSGRAFTPAGLLLAHVFARGQSELYRSDVRDTTDRLERGAELLSEAGLGHAARAFVPPAWLLSPSALEVVSRAGFDFYEVFGGIVHGGRLRAQRVVGWGSLNAFEALATSLYARAQIHLPLADTRLAIHPADMTRPRQRRAVRDAVMRLLPHMHALSYRSYLGAA